MIKIIEISKQLNKAELQLTGMKQFYIHFPTDLDVSDFFEVGEDADEPFIKKITFKETVSDEEYYCQYEQSREKRLTGVSKYFKNNLNPGDEVFLKKIVIGSSTPKYFISCKKLKNALVIQPLEDGFEILPPQKDYNEYCKNVFSLTGQRLKIEFIEAVKRRIDSKTFKNKYRIVVDGENLSESDELSDMYIIEIADNTLKVRKCYKWKKTVLEAR